MYLGIDKLMTLKNVFLEIYCFRQGKKTLGNKGSKYHQDIPGHINRETKQFWHVHEQWKFNIENSNMEMGRVVQNFTINPGLFQTPDLNDIAFSKSFVQELPLPTG